MILLNYIALDQSKKNRKVIGASQSLLQKKIYIGDIKDNSIVEKKLLRESDAQVLYPYSCFLPYVSISDAVCLLL